MPLRPERQKIAVLVPSLLLVLLIEWIDHITGREISFSIFYLLPILFVTWYVGPGWGSLFALGSTVAWIFADYRASELYSHPLVPLWNGLAGLIVFLVTILLLTLVKKKQERKRELERIFFHDVLNVATAIRGFAEILPAVDEESRGTVALHILNSSERIIDEIDAQRMVSAAEAHELRPEPEPVGACGLMEEMAALYRPHEAARGKDIVCACEEKGLSLETDPALLGRILGNMVKNALEASSPGETVTLRARPDGEWVEFSVHNPAVIPPVVQPHIFRRSYSTKGAGRGLGTYGMAILCRILGGEVRFASTAEKGTTFRARFPKAPPVEMRRNRSIIGSKG